MVVIIALQSRLMFEDQNPLERQTQDLQIKEGVGLDSLTKIMLLSQERKFEDICKYISQITNEPHQSYRPQNLQYQLQFLQAFYLALRGEQANIEDCNYYSNFNKYRALQLSINSKLKTNEAVDDRQVNELVRLVHLNPIIKQQVLMKAVGCRSVERMKQISIEEIEDTTQDQTKKAMKLDICGDWKFIIQQYEAALEIKSNAVSLWQKLRSDRQRKSKSQLEDIRKIIKGQEIQSGYLKKLICLRKIVNGLSKVENPNPNLISQRIIRKLSLNLYFLYSTKKLQIIHQQNIEKDNKSMGKSVLKRKGVVQERKQTGISFYQKKSKNNFIFSDFVPESKFETEQIKQMKKTFGVFDRVIKKFYRLYFQKMKMQYILIQKYIEDNQTSQLNEKDS